MDPSRASAAELLAHDTLLRRLARGLTADEAGADDLVQETWLAALETGAAERSRLRAWLVRVLRNLAASALRARVRREARETHRAATECQRDTTELVERMELHRRLVTAVLALPEAYREVILRHYFRGESVRSMAAALARPEATVRTRLRRARAQLRAELGDSPSSQLGATLVAALAGPDTHWIPEWIMKKTLATKLVVQTPLLVGGLLGVGLGFGGSLLVRAEPAVELRADERAAPAAIAAPAARPADEHVERTPQELTLPARVPVRASEAAPEPPPSMTADELRALLFSADRLDQVRAIRLLAGRGTPADRALLFDAFLDTDDEILLALLEEALHESGVEISALVLESYRTTLDPERLERLAGMLQALIAREPGLEPEMVALLAGALRDPGPNGERLAGLDGVLVALGDSALVALTEYLSDPLADQRGVGVAARALVQIDPSAAEAVQERLGQTLDALIAGVSDEALDEERRAALLERTTSMAWAASNRPQAEHDPLGDMLVERLLDVALPDQAQTLAWGVTNLKGLSDAARADVVRSLLEALPGQASFELRECYAWTVSQLARGSGGALGPAFFDIQRIVEQHLDRAGSAAFASQLDWLLGELERIRARAGG